MTKPIRDLYSEVNNFFQINNCYVFSSRFILDWSAHIICKKEIVTKVDSFIYTRIFFSVQFHLKNKNHLVAFGVFGAACVSCVH